MLTILLVQIFRQESLSSGASKEGGSGREREARPEERGRGQHGPPGLLEVERRLVRAPRARPRPVEATAGAAIVVTHFGTRQVQGLHLAVRRLGALN